MQVFQRFGAGKGNLDADPMVWGGKGAGLARMAAQGYPVPPGFTISTEMCKVFQEAPEDVLDAIMADIDPHLQFIEEQFGYMPLVSVRSGAPISMPGMMDTILNVGAMTDECDAAMDKMSNRQAFDCQRRLLQMMGSTAMGIEHHLFETVLSVFRQQTGVKTDAELTAQDLEQIGEKFAQLYKEAGHEIPGTLKDQLRVCIKAVFASWMSPNAIEYRKIEGIDESLGTAVTVQAMVFGNMNDNSGSGVLFTRNPSTGECKIFAEYLPNAQGEDVVAGIRTPEVLDLEAAKLTPWQIELAGLCDQLEADYKDMVDAEFTVQDGKLFMLQSRVGKRSAQAAFRIAVDMLHEGMIDTKTMMNRVKKKHLLTIRRPSIDPAFKDQPKWTGIAASMGIATGQVWKSSQMAASMAASGHKVILVTEETTPDDIAGMAASVGILTRTGGATSHAAVVARGMDKPCVVGCYDMKLNDLPEGTIISIDGETGRVWLGEVPVVGGTYSTDVRQFLATLMEEAGVLPQAEVPAPGVAVPLSCWLPLTDAEIADRINTALVMIEQGYELTFDITPPHRYGDQADDFIWNVAGTVLEDERFMERVLHPVMHSKLKAVRIIGGTDSQRELFQMKGFKVMRSAQTLEDLIGETGVVQIDATMEKFLGPNGLQILREKGMFKGKVFAGSQPPAYAAFKLLGE